MVPRRPSGPRPRHACALDHAQASLLPLLCGAGRPFKPSPARRRPPPSRARPSPACARAHAQRGEGEGSPASDRGARVARAWVRAEDRRAGVGQCAAGALPPPGAGRPFKPSPAHRRPRPRARARPVARLRERTRPRAMRRPPPACDRSRRADALSSLRCGPPIQTLARPPPPAPSRARLCGAAARSNPRPPAAAHPPRARARRPPASARTPASNAPPVARLHARKSRR